jgi:hypothetical protein
MADQSDVETALVSLVATALYPNGPDEPSSIGPDCRIYRGWPTSAALDADLAAGRINVTIFPQGEQGRNTTRFTPRWYGTDVLPSITTSVQDTSVAFVGSAGAIQLLGVLVENRSYVYRTRPVDTPQIVAANIAALIRADRIVTLSGASIDIPGAGTIVARSVAETPVMQEVRRQQQRFRVTCWCPSPASRDSAASAVDLQMSLYPFIQLQDGTQGRMVYFGSLVFDQSQDALLYRRDLLYDIEYATTLNTTLPTMLFGDLQLNAATFTA